MKDYCTCGFRRIEHTFLSGGSVNCSDCRQPICCDVVRTDPTVETHPAETRNEGRFACWQHRYGVADLVGAHAMNKQ